MANQKYREFFSFPRKIFLAVYFISALCLAPSACKTSNPREPGPFGASLYVRGTMNDWRPENKMEYDGTKYWAVIELAPALYSFKIGDASWSKVDLGCPPQSKNEVIKPFANKTLVTRGSDIKVSIETAGTYFFGMDASTSDEPVLTVARAKVQ